MGNSLLELLHILPKHSPKIKIVTTDGHQRKFDAPMSVKEVLADHPGHAIFLSENRARPLKGTVALQSGKIYFLMPDVSQRLDPTNKTLALSVDKLGSLGLEEKAKAVSRHVSFASTPSYIEPPQIPVEVDSLHKASPDSLHKASPDGFLEVLPGSEDDGVRLKVVVSKRQLEQLLREGGDIIESLLNPLLEESKLRRKCPPL